MCLLATVASVSTEPAPPTLTAAWRGLVDDAAIFPPGDAPLAEAAAAHVERRSRPYGDLVGTFVAKDTDLPALKATPLALSVVVTGGAGAVAGVASLARKLHIAVDQTRARELGLTQQDVANSVQRSTRRVLEAVDWSSQGEQKQAGTSTWAAFMAHLRKSNLTAKYSLGTVSDGASVGVGHQIGRDALGARSQRCVARRLGRPGRRLHRGNRD